MKISVSYLAQVKKAAGIGEEEITINDKCSVNDLAVKYLCDKNDGLKNLLIKENGELNKSVLVFVGDNQVEITDTEKYLRDGDDVTVMTPIAGG